LAPAQEKHLAALLLPRGPVGDPFLGEQKSRGRGEAGWPAQWAASRGHGGDQLNSCSAPKGLACLPVFSMSAVQRLEFSGVEEKQWDNDKLGAQTILKIAEGFFQN